MNKTFTTFSKADCLEAYPKILQIASSHWEDATVIYERGRYGLAISLHIISIEEYIKACILALDGRGFRFRKIKGMEAILSKNHNLRYMIAYGLFLMAKVGLFMKSTLFKLQQDDQFEERLRTSIQHDESYQDRLFKIFWLRQFSKVQKELKYFASVDQQRQDGMYSGYVHSLKTPELITYEDYHMLHSKLSPTKSMIDGFLKYLFIDDEEVREKIDELRRFFHKQKFYLILGEMLTDVMGPQKDVFDIVDKFFTPLIESLNKKTTINETSS